MMGGFRPRVAALVAVCVFGAALFPFANAMAAPLKGYEAVRVSATSKVSLAPGEAKRVTFGFQNVGTTAWSREDGAFVSVYTYGPKYRASAFRDATWAGDAQPARLVESSVRPGEVGTVAFLLRAPTTATPGAYTETFKLAAEDTAWIPGGEFSVAVNVVGVGNTQDAMVNIQAKEEKIQGTNDNARASAGQTQEIHTELAGVVLLRSAKKMTAKANETLSFTVGIKNTGSAAWGTRALYEGGVRAASIDGKAAVASKASGTVAPGAIDLIDFSFRAPSTRGTHTVSYVLAVDGKVVPELEIDIPVEVTSGAPEVKDKPKREKKSEKNSKLQETKPKKTNGIVEALDMEDPSIRVGVLIVDEETDNEVVVSCEDDWKLYDGEGGLLAELDGGESVEARYKNRRYYFDRGNGEERTGSYLRFVPDEENGVCTVENFDRTVTRNAAYPDNQFRNALELRHNDAKDRTWLINELSVETYLKGLGETSNISHLEFQKTLITVARTYALYHWERYTKHDEEYFHMTAYADDQVYRGYGQEKRSPRIVQSAEATRGVVVTYEGKTAITPYFSRSDGRTRDWGEVWYGDVAWLKGVPAPCDKGKTLWGHGVGLSASEALCQANNGKEWTDILKYFYTGIDLTKRWK